MADNPAEVIAKLQLDEKTGDMVSKNELKKIMQKRAKKAASAARKADPTINASGASQKMPSAPLQMSNVDPNAMFQQGWLAEVFRERPVDEVVSRFPPEPIEYLHLGHAKAIAVNLGFARTHSGKTVRMISMRLDVLADSLSDSEVRALRSLL